MLIDPILVSDACLVHDSGTIEVADTISDHKATHVSIKISVNLNTSYFREIWNYKNADYNELNSLTSNYNWDSIINDNTVLKSVNTHKHLGVILASNNKWNKHIDSIIESASKQISYLRKVKYQFSKEI